jgi:L-asparaginase/Glu-tRNA(Gln) amidotransferase subunit D
VLGTIGVNFKIYWERLLGHSFFGEMRVFENLSTEISTISIAPILNYKMIEAVLANSKAVIIQAFGMGNIPTNNSKFMELL